jgi:integrase
MLPKVGGKNMATKAKPARDGIYERADRGGFWMSYKDIYGKRKSVKCKARTLSGAREELRLKVIEVEEERRNPTPKTTDDSFKDLGTRYLKYQKPRLSERAYERANGIVEGHLTPYFKSPVREIRKTQIVDYMSARYNEVTAGTVLKEFNVLKHMLKLAAEWGIIAISPAIDLRPSKRVAPGRIRYLKPAELGLLLNASPEWLRPIILLAVSTGMRRGEILSVRWLDVDLKHGCIILPQTKNGDGRVVYLNKLARTVFSAMKRGQPTEILFPVTTPENVSVAFKRLCDDVKLDDFHFHDLRHTAASWLRMQGADIHSVATLLGHKDLRMAIRYQHLNADHLSKTVALMDKVKVKMPKMLTS